MASPVQVQPIPTIGFRYSHILRCIGQSLEPLDLKAVDVKRQGHAYLIQGWSKSMSSTVDLEQRYTMEDIRNLEMEGRKKRQRVPSIPNLLSLSQVLRLAGNYVDRLCGHLLRVSWQCQSDKIQSITVQYEIPHDGRKDSDDAQIATIDEISLHLYKQRKKISGASEKFYHRQSPN